jgi:hypothetical protein
MNKQTSTSHVKQHWLNCFRILVSLLVVEQLKVWMITSIGGDLMLRYDSNEQLSILLKISTVTQKMHLINLTLEEAHQEQNEDRGHSFYTRSIIRENIKDAQGNIEVFQETYQEILEAYSRIPNVEIRNEIQSFLHHEESRFQRKEIRFKEICGILGFSSTRKNENDGKGKGPDRDQGSDSDNSKGRGSDSDKSEGPEAPKY